jgi:hypothetical protein
MNLFEMFSVMPDGYQTPAEDHSVAKKSDTRKTRLTLRQINKLRIMNDIRRIEHEKDIEKAVKQYGAQPAEGGGAPPLV